VRDQPKFEVYAQVVTVNSHYWLIECYEENSITIHPPLERASLCQLAIIKFTEPQDGEIINSCNSSVH